MKNTPHKYQHYVPQCYLKLFGHKKNSGNGFYINAYSKKMNRSFRINVSKVCGEDFFYSLPEDIVQNCSDDALRNLSIEIDYFAKDIEAEYSLILKKIQKETSSCIENNTKRLFFTQEDRFLLASQIAIQYLRLPEVRKYDEDFSKELYKDVIPLFSELVALEKGDPKYKNINFKINSNSVVDHALFSFMNNDVINYFAKALAKKIWHFYYSDKLFYTCDSPIFANHTEKYVCEECLGLASYGVETSIALNPSLILNIVDNRKFSELAETDGLFIKANNAIIERLNRFRYIHAKEYIFCYNADFSSINKF